MTGCFNVAVDVLIVVVVLLLQASYCILTFCWCYAVIVTQCQSDIRAHILPQGSFMQVFVLIYKVFHDFLLRFLLSCNNHPC